MQALNDTIIPVRESARENIARLSAVSHKSPMNLETVVDWKNGIDFSKPPKEMDQLWIADTPYEAQLSDQQKTELAWKETARDVSMFIWLEQTLPPLYVGYVHKNMGKLSKEVEEYLMVFSREEIVHTLVFKRYMEMAGLDLFEPPELLYHLLSEVLPTLPPPLGIMVTLMLEWVAEAGAIHGTQGAEIDPLTRELFKQHHVEELRHIAFGRWVAESFMETADEPQRQQAKAMLREVYNKIVANFSFNREIARHVSFDFPADVSDDAIVTAIQTSERNIALNKERFGQMNDWLTRLGIID